MGKKWKCPKCGLKDNYPMFCMPCCHTICIDCSGDRCFTCENKIDNIYPNYTVGDLNGLTYNKEEKKIRITKLKMTQNSCIIDWEGYTDREEKVFISRDYDDHLTVDINDEIVFSGNFPELYDTDDLLQILTTRTKQFTFDLSYD